MPPFEGQEDSRRVLLLKAASLLSIGAALSGASTTAEAKDYATRREALDELDRLAAICGMRLGELRRSRSGSDLLAARFLNELSRQRRTRDEMRRRFGLPRGLDPASQMDVVSADLKELRQALDDLMVAYAESLPIFGDSHAVSRLAVDMVAVSRLRTVVDLWAEAEDA
jgi:hypothetical protein